MYISREMEYRNILHTCNNRLELISEVITMIKAAIFDMDGVIIDSEPDHLKLEERIFEKLGIEVSRKEHQSSVGTTLHIMK